MCTSRKTDLLVSLELLLFAANLEDVVTVQLNLGLLSVNIPIFPLPSLTAYWC